MNTLQCRRCGLNKGTYIENKSPSKTGIIIAALLWAVGLLGSIMFVIFIPAGIVLFVTGLLCLLLIKERKVFCAVCDKPLLR